MSPITRNRKRPDAGITAIATGRAKTRPAGSVFVAALAVLLVTALPSRPAVADSVHRIDVGGVTRVYELHVPPRLAAGLALVIVLHGVAATGAAVAAVTGFNAEADARDFLVAYPEGTDASPGSGGESGYRSWNAGACCGIALRAASDDVGFIRAMVAEIAGRLSVDPHRIYAAGFSNGGMMAYRLACDASDLIAAVGVVSGVSVAAPCEPWYPVAVIDFHGSADESVPIDGGPGAKSITGFSYPAVATSIAWWAAHDDCGRLPIVSAPAPGVTLQDYPLCVGNSAVAYYVISGGGHSWPDGRNAALAATPLIWSFFAEHAKTNVR